MPLQSPALRSAHPSYRGWVVRDFDGHDIVYVPEDHLGGPAYWAKVLTRDQARWIATNIAKLPGSLNKDSNALGHRVDDATVFQKAPAPWNTYRGKGRSGGPYMVRAANGLEVAIIPYRRKQHLSEKEAKNIAIEIAKLPEHCRVAI